MKAVLHVLVPYDKIALLLPWYHLTVLVLVDVLSQFFEDGVRLLFRHVVEVVDI